MLTITHRPINLATWATITATTYTPIPLILGGTIVVALSGLPDIDTPDSRWGKRYPRISRYLDHKWGHRKSPTHWIITPVLISALIGIPATMVSASLWWIGASVLTSWGAHILADTLTYQGVMMFRPFTSKTIRPRYGRRIRCGGKIETIIRYLAYGWLVGSLVSLL